MSLFGDEEVTNDTVPIPNVPELSDDEKLRDEKEYNSGFYITGHPLQGYRAEMKGLFELGVA